MAVDDRYKRAAATAMLLPFMFTTHTDTTNAVDDEERWAVSWMYSGIAIGEAVGWINIIIQGVDRVTQERIDIMGKYRLP
jgi:hypothetical protein